MQRLAHAGQGSKKNKNGFASLGASGGGRRVRNALLLISPTVELTQLEKVLNADIKLLEAQLAAGKRHGASSSSEGEVMDGGGTTVIHNENTIQGLE